MKSINWPLITLVVTSNLKSAILFGPVLTKERFPAHEYNKLKARRIGPVRILEKINANAYCLELPTGMKTTNIFNVKHLAPFLGDNPPTPTVVPDSRSNLF
ncbi:CCHC-type domain-containing protein [Abeliophyllum distichum]|uniref:CCHC-type domain-containing protein n=1 Tax=Abeliophyllum distichum TaxID=126358 RepID=A0ABD1US04_9LAMI